MGRDMTDDDYLLLSILTSWPALALTIAVAGLLSILFILCEMREVRGWRDRVVVTLFTVSSIVAVFHMMVMSFIRGLTR